MLPRFIFRYLFTEIIIQRMRNIPGRLARQGFQICQYFFTHGDERVNRLYEIFRKSFIAKTLFMWNDIIGNTNNPGMLILFCDAKDRSEAWSHERKPVTHNNNIGPLFLQSSAGPDPVKRVNGIDNNIYLNILWSGFR